MPRNSSTDSDAPAAHPRSATVGLLATALRLAVVMGVALPALSAAAPAASSVPPALPRSSSARIHIVPMQGARPASAETAPYLSYWGGPVISLVRIVMVLYGTGVDSVVTTRMPSFYQQMVDSPAMDWLCEYDTNILDAYSRPGTWQAIQRGSWAGTFAITPDSSRNGPTITDAQIQAELAAQIDAGHLPAPDANNLYMLHFPPGKTIEFDPSNLSCQTFCGYHWAFAHTGVSVRYGVVPDLSPCASGCTGHTAFDAGTITAWHEMIEAVTDPDTVYSWYDFGESSPGNQWGEIGDICSSDTLTFIAGNGAAYVIQGLWSNRQNSCAISGPGCSPAAVAGGPGAEPSLDLASANPLRGPARFRLGLTAPSAVDLAVYDVAGRRVADLLHGAMDAGEHMVSWTAETGAGPGAGVYFARLRAGGRTYSRMVVLLK